MKTPAMKSPTMKTLLLSAALAVVTALVLAMTKRESGAGVDWRKFLPPAVQNDSPMWNRTLLFKNGDNAIQKRGLN